ncbi:uncharacterized protein LOC122019032 [Zingiber officinale]|uniref:uncharacterized protein LOC122019032 n=1 Tax=Zingiber officinale TaxID=94328 RepID=UPI001C4D426C|nr:uncharacterized protein LOC122019032 [Zingiber officinale]
MEDTQSWPQQLSPEDQTPASEMNWNPPSQSKQQSGSAESHGIKSALENSLISDPNDIQRELKVKLSKEMDEFLLKIKEGWKSEIAKLNRPTSNMTTVLNDQTWAFVKENLIVQLRAAAGELKEKGQEQIKETLVKSSISIDTIKQKLELEKCLAIVVWFVGIALILITGIIKIFLKF